jgi:hypothetical protein
MKTISGFATLAVIIWLASCIPTTIAFIQALAH